MANRRVENAFGRTMPSLSAWAAAYGIPLPTLAHRLNRGKGMTLEQALTMPKRRGGNPKGSHHEGWEYGESWHAESDDPAAWLGGGLTRYGQRLMREDSDR